MQLARKPARIYLLRHTPEGVGSTRGHSCGSCYVRENCQQTIQARLTCIVCDAWLESGLDDGVRSIREYAGIIEQVPTNAALLDHWVSKEVVNSPLCLFHREIGLDLIPQYDSDSANLYSVIRGEHSLD